MRYSFILLILFIACQKDDPYQTHSIEGYVVGYGPCSVAMSYQDTAFEGSRAQKVVIELLHGYQGAVQTDGYEAYSIYENKKGVLLLGCWAHARSYQYF